MNARDPSKPPAEPREWSFQTMLFIALAGTSLLVFLPGLILLAALPGQELQRLTDIAATVVAATQSLVPAEELTRVIDFAEGMTSADRAALAVNQADHRDQAFRFLIQDGRLPPRAEILAGVGEVEASDWRVDAWQDSDFRLLQAHFEAWQALAGTHPEVFDSHRRVSGALRSIHRAAGAGRAQSWSLLSHVYILYRPATGDDDSWAMTGLSSLTWRELVGSPGTAMALPALEAAPPGFARVRLPRLLTTPFRTWEIAGLPILGRVQFYSDPWGTWFTVASRSTDTRGRPVLFAVDFRADGIGRLLDRVRLGAAAAAALLLGTTVVLSLWVAGRVGRPVAALHAGAVAVMRGELDVRVADVGRGELRRLIDTFNRMVGWVQERTNLRDTLRRLLSDDLAESAARDGIQLGGQDAVCTIMFTDFCGFSTVSRGRSPQEIVAALNDYFGHLIPTIKAHGGLPDKYIGDAIVALFGAPVPSETHAGQAVRCAIAMQRALRRFNAARRERGELVFEMRVGLHTGDAVVGAIGCDDKLEYTAIGEAVNLANRMEAACPIGHVLISETTWRACPPDIATELDAVVDSHLVAVKGYDTAVVAHRVFVDDLWVEKVVDGGDSASIYRYSRRSAPGRAVSG